MEEDYVTVSEGTDDGAECDYIISVKRNEFDNTSIGGNSDCGLMVEVFRNDIPISETHINVELVLEVYGRVSESEREALIRRLESEGVPFAARTETASAIFDDVQNGFTDASVVILIDTYEYYRRTRDGAMEDEEEEEDEDGFFHQRPTPASRDAVEALERVRVGPEGETCVVCMDDMIMSSMDMMIKMPCAHVFHGDCLLAWLQNRCHCPLCRFKLPA